MAPVITKWLQTIHYDSKLSVLKDLGKSNLKGLKKKYAENNCFELNFE